MTPRIDLHCRHCGHTWHAPTMIAGVWWPPAVTPAGIAARCWCPACQAAPPMAAATPSPLSGSFTLCSCEVTP